MYISLFSYVLIIVEFQKYISSYFVFKEKY